MKLSAASTELTDWTISQSVGLGQPAWIGPSNPFGLSASAGSYFLDLTGYSFGSPYGGVSQTFPTAIGTTYVLSFDLGSTADEGGTAGINATAGSATQDFTFTTSLNNQWMTESLIFTATAATTNITPQGSAGTNYIGLDNVTVAPAVPEPASLMVWLLIGLSIGVAGWRRRRKQVA